MSRSGLFQGTSRNMPTQISRDLEVEQQGQDQQSICLAYLGNLSLQKACQLSGNKKHQDITRLAGEVRGDIDRCRQDVKSAIDTLGQVVGVAC
ncbi:uncharacterized protein PgNI_11558 [Pyricularia grisea]|uniref:Uncharacterized protein n=1 Tax=Pyricularia grisea TaxID=148305 RepID=A0A6P8AN46_PYRGI|nr:uncharacterized protein PgNI_11558 [Pyricularia grisea]TLD03462.1 hypothetical protein PgNI_11558 [Pyricularia grisea]